MSARQRFGVEVSVAELLARGKEAVWGGFFEAAFELLSRLIVAGVEHEMDEFVGARWHERGRRAGSPARPEASSASGRRTHGARAEQRGHELFRLHSFISFGGLWVATPHLNRRTHGEIRVR